MEFFPIPPPRSNPFAVTTCEDRGCVLAILSGHQSGLDRSTASLCFPNLEDDFRKSKRGVLSAATFRGDRQEDRKKEDRSFQQQKVRRRLESSLSLDKGTAALSIIPIPTRFPDPWTVFVG
ncbi:hypothetical protein NL676_003176 [Syzygium grande]|nr:hypothetical protein NL676_003176 [Syzygium grande]